MRSRAVEFFAFASILVATVFVVLFDRPDREVR